MDIKIFVDTENPNEFIDNIKKDLSDFEISKSDFERKKKMILSEVILNFENIQSANDFISYHVNKFKDPILEFHSIFHNRQSNTNNQEQPLIQLHVYNQQYFDS